MFILLGVVMLEHVPDTTICFAVDITERKRVERELAAAKESAEAASRAKDHFLAVLSHELRTPLTPVLGAVQALYDSTGLEEEDRMLVDIVRRNVELEARLIDDLLDLTRIERGKVQLNFEVVDAHALLGSALEICRDDIASKRQVVSVDLDAPRHHAYADPARLQQVFWNLIKNAVKFTPEGGKIAIRSRIAGNGNLQVEVSDTGIGIDRDLLPKIFDAFEQGGRGITRQFGGLGLGLAISRTVMQLHGGKLTASSGGEGEGATFVVELGLLDPVSVEPRAPVTIPVQESIGDPKNVRILLVDDHKDTNRVMQLFLNRQGYQVYTAHTMSSALALAAGKEFDLVISDIGLPDGSGLDLMRKLRSERPVKGIALSGYGMEEDVRRSIEVGFSEHLTKPVSAQRLQEVIQRIITADVERAPAV